MRSWLRQLLIDSASWLIRLCRKVGRCHGRISADKPRDKDCQVQGTSGRFHYRQRARTLGGRRDVPETDGGERTETEIEGVETIHAPLGTADQRKLETIRRDLS